ncbi:hypothetical protein [Aquella oligotrophica]|uniref:Uncharacterized protein n=1 Tax=Aquella oligotrophica TaxID=2067065 RepID=A0A2I7N935_9NEIS|nr:hypothetical protein [Aquella oligotrophica]AUR52952.1 hypothetical protein CUN60_11815 [Aquella oligotrophica]
MKKILLLLGIFGITHVFATPDIYLTINNNTSAAYTISVTDSYHFDCQLEGQKDSKDCGDEVQFLNQQVIKANSSFHVRVTPQVVEEKSSMLIYLLPSETTQLLLGFGLWGYETGSDHLPPSDAYKHYNLSYNASYANNTNWSELHSSGDCVRGMMLETSNPLVTTSMAFIENSSNHYYTATVNVNQSLIASATRLPW